MGIHECGVGDVDVVDKSVDTPLGGRDGLSTMPGRACENAYPLWRCVSGVVPGGACFAVEACVLIVGSVHV
jgi:hypothetical protein